MQISWLLPLALLCVAEGARKPTPPPNPKSGGDLTDECPERNGFFADGYQCDKYYECRDGVIEEKLCPDGMVFNDYSPQVEKCDLPFNIDCSERPERQTPKPSPHCPRQNGYFAHEEAGVCDKFYFCVDGKYNMITCPAGLVYNEKTGICTWPDEAKKKGCSSEGSQVRQKRLTFWPKKEQEGVGSQEASEEQKKEDRSEEGSDEYHDYDDASSNNKNKDYENVSSNPDNKDYHDGDGGSQNGNKDYGDEDESSFYDEFSSNPEFSDFDFENFGGSRESGDFYDHRNLQRRRDEQLDGYIREYVAQLNKDPVKASGPMDLSYYEKIAEATVEKGRIPSITTCHGNETPLHSNSFSEFDCLQFLHQCFPRHDAGFFRAQNKSDVFKFECPKVDMTQAQQHPRYPDPEDCQFFYVCINGEVPRRNGCKLGQVFNEGTGACDWPRNVPECQDWYKGVLTDEELYALEHPKPRTRSNSTSSRGPQRKHQVRVE